jgi:Peptidase family M28
LTLLLQPPNLGHKESIIEGETNLKVVLKINWLVLFLFTSMAAVIAEPNKIPFLSEDDYQWLSNEISGDASFEHIRYMSQFHRPTGGEGLMKVAEYVEKKAIEYGLEDVKLTKQAHTRRPWNAKYGEIWLSSPGIRLLASTNQVLLHLADNSRTTHIKDVEIVYVGKGISDQDYEGLDVEGKIVLAYGGNRGVMAEAVWEREAAGLISFPNPRVPDYPVNALNRPDQIHWSRIPVESSEGQPGTFAFMISSRQAMELRNLIESGDPVKAKVDIESQFGSPEEAWQVMVKGRIKGTEIRNQDIVLTAHMQEEKFSANDDSSGCANLLEIGRALQKLITEGHIKNPRRNIVFWWVTEISSQRQYFADNPEDHKNMMVNINQDMVGANQAQDVMRVQNMTLVPFSRFHFLNDVAESVLDFIIEGNQANLAVLQAGNPEIYPRAIFSKLGTRHRFNAAAVPFHNNSDHMTFNEAPIGVPGISFTNWPDNYIHSSDDDLWNVDPTQLQRNAFAVAMMSYVIAAADGVTVPEISALVSGRGIERIGADYRLALSWIAGDRSEYFGAVHQVKEAVKRERLAVHSLRQLCETEQLRAVVKGYQDQLSMAESSLLKGLENQFSTSYGTSPGENEQLTDTKKKLKALVPSIKGDAEDFLTGRRNIKRVKGLHGIMAFEVISFIDGKRSGLDIFQAVRAEARRAGVHYYGRVNAEDVYQYLNNAAETGLVGL